MLSLESNQWSELQHAYGSASDIPNLLSQLDVLPDSNGNDEPWFSIWSALAHQGDVYPASFAAVPHVIQAIAVSPVDASYVYFQFPAWIEICRQKKKIEIPADLAPVYFQALSQLPFLVAQASAREWDEDFSRCALSAIAAAKGQVHVAEALLELSSEIAKEFMDWFFSR